MSVPIWINDHTHISRLFRIFAEADREHATVQKSLVKGIVVNDTDTNLEHSFQREMWINAPLYWVRHPPPKLSHGVFDVWRNSMVNRLCAMFWERTPGSLL